MTIPIAGIRIGLLIAQMGLPLVKDLIGLLKQEKVTLPDLEKILDDIAVHKKEADEATDKILNH